MCQRVRGSDVCNLLPPGECNGPETKEYLEGVLEGVRGVGADGGGGVNETFDEYTLHVLYTLFYHALNCVIVGVCQLPLCNQFRDAIKWVKQKEGMLVLSWVLISKFETFILQDEALFFHICRPNFHFV